MTEGLIPTKSPSEPFRERKPSMTYNRPSKNSYYLSIAEAVLVRSTCLRRKGYQPEPEVQEEASNLNVYLSPCLFCGGMPELAFTEIIPKTKNCRIYCPRCGLEHWHSLPLEENVARWNRRVQA